MRIEKASLQLGGEIIAWAKSGNILLSKKPVKINTCSLVEGDVVQISKNSLKTPAAKAVTATMDEQGLVEEAFIKSCENPARALAQGNSVSVNNGMLMESNFEKYKKTSWLKKLKMLCMTPSSTKKLVELNYNGANQLRDFCNKKYGEGNYTLLILGRSLASMGEVAAQMGVDVKFLPLSGLRYVSKKEVLNISNIERYKKYLDSIGLTKESIAQNPQHHFVLADFTSSGQSLDLGHTFFTRKDMLGNPERIEKLSASKIFGEDSLLNTSLNLEKFKSFSPVGSVSIHQLDDIFVEMNLDVVPRCSEDRLSREFFVFNSMRLLNKNKVCR